MIPVPDESKLLADIDDVLRRIGGNRLLLDHICRILSDSAKKLLDDMTQRMASGNRDGVLNSLHALRGVAGTAGAARLAAHAGALETWLRQASSLPDSASLLGPLSALTEASCTAFTAALETSRSRAATGEAAVGSTGASGSNADHTDLVKELTALESLLATGNMRATSLFVTLEERFGACLGARFAPLASAIRTLDFAAAAEHSRALRAALARG